MTTFFGEIDAFVAANQGDETLKPFVDGLAGVQGAAAGGHACG